LPEYAGIAREEVPVVLYVPHDEIGMAGVPRWRTLQAQPPSLSGEPDVGSGVVDPLHYAATVSVDCTGSGPRPRAGKDHFAANTDCS
jgi:hypothetical protein